MYSSKQRNQLVEETARKTKGLAQSKSAAVIQPIKNIYTINEKGQIQTLKQQDQDVAVG